MTNASGYANPFRVAANSRQVTKYEFAQTSSAQIDAIALSSDGTHAIFREFPAGAGIVPGDTSMTWTYFATNLTTGDSFEIGPDWSRWTNWFQAPYPSVAINPSGTAVAWAVAYPDGDKPIAIEMQSGVGLATKTTLDTFSASATVWVYAMNQSGVLVRVHDGDVDELRTYTASGTFEVVPDSGFQPMSAVYSANGSAIGFMNNNSETMRCVTNGVVTTFAAPTQLGSSYPGQIRVANDCSWLMTTWDIAPGWPRGQHGLQLIKIWADGHLTKLDSSTGTDVGWVSNLAATKFLRVTTNALEPGDINGLLDIYRGLGSPSETPVKLKGTPRLVIDSVIPSVHYKSSITPPVSSPDSSSEIKIAVIGGSCHVEGGKIVADSGLGTCVYRASIAENADWLAAEATGYVTFEKILQSTTNLSITAPQMVEVGSDISYTLNNPDGLPFQLRTFGECGFLNGKLKAFAVGACTLDAVAYETENYLETHISATVTITKQTWPTSAFSVAPVGTKYSGDVFNLVLTNTTGLSPNYFADGACTVDQGTVTILASGGSTCTIIVAVRESENHGVTATTLVIPVATRASVAPRVIDSDWASTNLLPKGSSLTFNSNLTLVSGACSVSAEKLTALGTSGSCVVRAGGYSFGAVSFTLVTFTIKLGPATQTWKSVLPTYSSKKLSTAKFVIPMKGYAITSLGLKGTWSASSGCKLVTAATSVTLDMGKLKKCVVTLRSPAGFRVPALTKTFTFTR